MFKFSSIVLLALAFCIVLSSLSFGQDWRTYKSRSGASISYPPGWEVHESEYGTLVAYRPFNGGLDAMATVDLMPYDGTADEILWEIGEYHPRLLPELEDNEPRPMSGDRGVFTRKLKYFGGDMAFTGTSMCSVKGGEGLLWFGGSSSDTWERDKKTVLGILRSYSPPPGSAHAKTRAAGRGTSGIPAPGGRSSGVPGGGVPMGGTVSGGGNPPPTAPPAQWSGAGAPPASSPPQGSPPPSASTGGTQGRASTLKVPRMIPWSDPNENAFSCPVPEGWSVQGGLVRLNALDIRPELLAVSPDGQVLVRIGDSFIGLMVNFNQAMQGYGFPEGSTYGPYGVQMLVLRYLPGVRYALDYYLPNRLGQFGGVREQDLPQLSQQAQAIYSRVGLPVRVDTGEALFDAQTQEGPRKGYIFCQTRLTSSPGLPQGTGSWEVLTLMGYLAAPGHEALAEAVFSAMASGFKPNPAWLTRQAQTAGQVGNIVAETTAEVNGIIRNTFENRQRAQDRSAERFGRYIRDETLVRDPNTGETGTVAGHDDRYFRREHTNEVVGADAGQDRPYDSSGWFNELERVD